jgi:hypothetical protein
MMFEEVNSALSAEPKVIETAVAGDARIREGNSSIPLIPLQHEQRAGCRPMYLRDGVSKVLLSNALIHARRTPQIEKLKWRPIVCLVCRCHTSAYLKQSATELNTIARHRSTLMRMQYLLAIGVFALLLGTVVWIALEYVPR